MKPYVEDPDFQLFHGDALEVLRTMPDGSVDCVATSPPFYALRDYGTGRWEGGDEDCDHSKRSSPKVSSAPGGSSTLNGPATNDNHEREGWGALCGRCGARRIDQQIGLEASPQEWVDKLVGVFRECRRVLVDHGTLFIEVGDSYVGSSMNGGPVSGPLVGSGHRERGEGFDSKPLRVDGLKPKDLLGTPWMLAFALRADGWWLRQSIIWHKPNCLSGGTQLYARTQKGEAPAMLKDLVRLDPSTVELWNGEYWTQVLAWTQNPSRYGALEIEFRSGEAVGCTPDHLWPTQRGNVRASELRIGDVVPMTALPGTLAETPRLVPDDLGWIVGLYLAEGSRSANTLQFSCHANEVGDVFRRLYEYADAYDGVARQHVYGNKATVNVDCPALTALIDGYIHRGSARTKCLRRKAWSRSNGFSRSLLDGYLYGDGHWDAKNGRWRLGFTRNDQLASDLRCLAARLGATLSLRKSFSTAAGKRFPTYKGELRFYRSGHLNERPLGKVVSIKASRARKFWDVAVADEPHLFALASGLLTHNCMPESATDRCTTAHSYVFLLSKKARYHFDAKAIAEPAAWDRWGDQTVPKYEGTDTASGWMQPKTKAELTPGHFSSNFLDRRDEHPTDARKYTNPGNRSANGPASKAAKERIGADADRRGFDQRLERADGLKNPRSVWTIPTQGYPDAHFATWPEELVRRIIKAGCPEGGTVLDPFGGSGTTALVARKLGRRSVLIELSEPYCDLAARRLSQLSLLAEGAA